MRSLNHNKGASWELSGGNDGQRVAGLSQEPCLIWKAAPRPGYRRWKSQEVPRGVGQRRSTNPKLDLDQGYSN